MTGRPATLDELFGDDLSHQGTRYSATPNVRSGALSSAKLFAWATCRRP